MNKVIKRCNDVVTEIETVQESCDEIKDSMLEGSLEFIALNDATDQMLTAITALHKSIQSLNFYLTLTNEPA